MIEKKLQCVFQNYLAAFKSYDLDGVSNCYHLPCTLNTPDNLVLISDIQSCHREFSAIFEQLKAANTSQINALKIGFEQINEKIALVCIDWEFLDDNLQVFADFSAIYHLVDVAGQYKIINVVSHELTNSLNLAKTFSLS